MQKIYTLLLAAITTLVASAASGTPAKSFEKMPKNAVKVDSWHNNTSKTLKQHSKFLSNGPLKANNDSQAIFDPEGQKEKYSLTSTRFELIWNQLIISYGDFPSYVVFGENNKVYFQDIVTCAQSGVYVEGTRKGNQIVVRFPQVCFSETGEYEGEEYTDELYASKMEYYTYEKDGQTYIGYRNVAPEDNYVVYTINDDGIITLNLNQGDPANTESPTPYIIGVCGDCTPGIDDWYGIGELYQTFAPFSDKPNTIPDGVEMETWGMVSDEVDGLVQVGFDGDNVYIAGISEFFEDAVIIGKVDGDKITFQSSQFLGEFYGHFVWFNACLWTNTNWEEYEVLDNVVLNYDAENKVISTDNELIDFVFSASADEIDPLDYVTNPTFMYFTEEDLNAAPEDPYVAHFDDYAFREYIGDSEGFIEWVIPNTNVKGNLLDTDKMYYNFYIDGNILTFTTDVYNKFEEDLTDVPYKFDDGWDIQVIGEGHYITFKEENYSNFGLQSFYVGSDGVTYASNLVTYTPESAALSSITGKTLQRAELFDLQGRPISNPEAGGVYIMRSTFTDGTTNVTKMIKK